jgi:hypothetical protein
MIDHTQTLNAIAAELSEWQRDGRRSASDSLVRIAEFLHNTGRLDGRLPHFYARRECHVLDEA